MWRRIVAACFLVSLFTFLFASAFTPTFVLEARNDAGTRLFCSAIERDDEIVYHSINSIYRVPVEERLRAQDDGAFVAVKVISTPDVVYYYGIESFTRLTGDQVSAIPSDVRYRELRIKVGQRGQQRLVVRGQAIVLGDLVTQGEPVIVTLHSAPRVFACW